MTTAAQRTHSGTSDWIGSGEVVPPPMNTLPDPPTITAPHVDPASSIL